ncbi:MAG: terminase small subunit [Nitrospinales bacterium]
MATENKAKKKLNPKQQRFVEEYMIDLNATQAAIRSGYSNKRASEYGYQLLHKTTVNDEIQIAMANRSKRAEIDADRVIKELSIIAFSNICDYVDFGPHGAKLKASSGIPDKFTRAIALVKQSSTSDNGGSFAIKMHDKLLALDMLAKHFGMYRDKGDKGKPFEDTANLSSPIEIFRAKRDKKTKT